MPSTASCRGPSLGDLHGANQKTPSTSGLMRPPSANDMTTSPSFPTRSKGVCSMSLWGATRRIWPPITTPFPRRRNQALSRSPWTCGLLTSTPHWRRFPTQAVKSHSTNSMWPNTSAKRSTRSAARSTNSCWAKSART